MIKKIINSILSDGIHNLSEEQYELLKSAVEIILEDEIYKRNLEKRKKSIGNLLSNKSRKKSNGYKPRKVIIDNKE